MLSHRSCLALVAHLSLVFAIPATLSNTTLASTSTASGTETKFITSTSELLDYLSADKNAILGSVNLQSNSTRDQLNLNALAAALAINETVPTSNMNTITSASQLLTNPAEGSLIRWEDWGMSFPRYRRPETSIRDAQIFAQAMFVAIGINQLIARAGDYDQVQNARFHFRGERRIFRPSLLASLAGENSELTWIEVKAFAEIFMQWTAQFDSGMVPGTEVVLLDWNGRPMGFGVAKGAFLVGPSNGVGDVISVV